MKLRMHQHLHQQSQVQMTNLTFNRISNDELTPNCRQKNDEQPIDLSISKPRFQLAVHLSPSSKSRSSSVASTYSINHSSPFTSPTTPANTSTGTPLSPPESIEEDEEDTSYKRLNQVPTVSLNSGRRAARLAKRARLHTVTNQQEPPTIQTSNMGLGTVLNLPSSNSSCRSVPYSIPTGCSYTPLLTTAKPFNPILFRQSPSPMTGALTSDSPPLPMNIQPAHLQRPSPRRPTPPLPSHLSASLHHSNSHPLPLINTIPAHSKQPPFLSGSLISLSNQCQKRTFGVTSTAPVAPVLSSNANTHTSIALCEKLLAEQMQKARLAAAELVRAHLRAQGFQPIDLPNDSIAPFTNSSTESTASMESDSCSLPSGFSPPFSSLLAARLNQLHCTNIPRTSPTSLFGSGILPMTNQNHIPSSKPEYRRQRSPLPSQMQSANSPDSFSDSGESEEYDQRSRRFGGRPLTGRHVRSGTGASASTIALLRKMLKNKSRSKEQNCTPSVSNQVGTKSFPIETLVN